MQLNLVELFKETSISVPRLLLFQDEAWSLMESVGLMRWRIGDPIQESGDWLLIGLATYSLPDIRLAQIIIESALTLPDLKINVFDVNLVPGPTGFESYIPGIGKVFQTPVVGFWEKGRLMSAAAGYAGRKLLATVIPRVSELL